MDAKINKTVLMSGAEYFDDGKAINPYYFHQGTIDLEKAKAQHQAIRHALEEAGVKINKINPPEKCQDGIYTSNWALIRGKKAVMATLPPGRSSEEPYAEKVLKERGFTTYKVPNSFHFSGQADALPCGEFLFMGSGYRTQPKAHQFVIDTLGYTPVKLQTIPERGFFGFGKPVINKTTGWPDSFFYDIDLALAILRPPVGDQKGLIAWCPKAFTANSRKLLKEFDGVDKIEVGIKEAKRGFACNLVSTGETVVMSSRAPKLKADLEMRGFKVVTIEATELIKGGGFIRCICLTLDN